MLNRMAGELVLILKKITAKGIVIRVFITKLITE